MYSAPTAMSAAHTAAQRLVQSDRGTAALIAFRAFILEHGTGLDPGNRAALTILLQLTFDGHYCNVAAAIDATIPY